MVAAHSGNKGVVELQTEDLKLVTSVHLLMADYLCAYFSKHQRQRLTRSQFIKSTLGL